MKQRCKKKKNYYNKNTESTFFESLSLILSFSLLPVREAREKKPSSVWLTAPGAGGAILAALPPHFVYPLPLLSPFRWLLCGRKGSEWAKPSGSHLELGWTSPISAFFVKDPSEHTSAAEPLMTQEVLGCRRALGGNERGFWTLRD